MVTNQGRNKSKRRTCNNCNIFVFYNCIYAILKGNVEERAIKQEDTEVSFGHKGHERLSSKARKRDYSHGSIFAKEQSISGKSLKPGLTKKIGQSKKVNNSTLENASIQEEGRRGIAKENKQRQREMQVPKYSGVSHTRRKKCVKLKGINVSVSCEEVSRTDFKRSTIFGRSGLKITGSQE